MRLVTSAFQTAVAAKAIKPAVLIEMYFDSGNLFLWTGYGSLIWNSNTYTGAGQLLSFSEVKETNGLETNGITLALSGMSASVVSLALTEKYQNRPVKIYLALLDGTGAVIADPRTLFSGRADLMSISEDGDTATITLTVENFLVDLMRARARRYTDEDQKIDYPTDRFFEYVATLQDKTFKWGG